MAAWHEKNMSREDSIRKEILFQLYGLRPLARSVSALWRESRKQQLDYTRQELARETQCLADDGLLIAIELSGMTERMYRLNAAGVRHYEQNYAA